MLPKIAVIMSLYKNDTLEFVKLAVDSILNQTYRDFDFYIQYDGLIKEEVNKFLSNINDDRIVIHKRKENKGLAQSLNDLLNVVMPLGYEYIARMDADDISELKRFERQIRYLEDNLEIDCLGTWAIEINNNGEEYFRKQMPETHDGCKDLFRKRDCVIHPTVMFRRSFIEKAGLYSVETFFAEDTMMWAQGFAAGCKFGNIPEYLYFFRLDDNFFNRRRGWEHAKNIFLIRHKVNKMLHYGLIADVWALAYAVAKMMPRQILSIIYKKGRRV